MSKYALVLVMAASIMFGINAFANEGKDAKGGEHKKGEGWNAQTIFAKMDADSDGKVSKEEYVAFQEARAKKTGHAMTKEAIEARFAKMDTDKDGNLTMDEWKAASEAMKAQHAEHKAKTPEVKQ